MAMREPSDLAPRSARSTARRSLVTTELLDQATQLFASKGFDATTLQDIAAAMGISRPALYHYVRSKDELLEKLVEQVSQRLADVLAELTRRQDLTPTQKLRELTGLLVRQRAEHPAQFRILDQSENVLPEPAGTKHLEAKRRVLREMTAIIDQGIETGEFAAVPSRTAALSLLGMCNWVAWWIKPSADVGSIVQTLTEFADRMLARAGDGGPRSNPADALREIRSNLNWLEQHL